MCAILFFRDQKILELLYEESKYNILEGRYPCEIMHYISLGAIQAKIELGPYNPQIHTIQFFRYDAFNLSTSLFCPGSAPCD